jgi:hypothetical protein
MTMLLGPRADAHVRLPPIARVVLWMIGTLLSFSAMAVSIRELSATLSIMEILSARAAIGLLIVGALLALCPSRGARSTAAACACMSCATASTSAPSICGQRACCCCL